MLCRQQNDDNHEHKSYRVDMALNRNGAYMVVMIIDDTLTPNIIWKWSIFP
jgi:hypothetical protein